MTITYKILKQLNLSKKQCLVVIVFLGGLSLPAAMAQSPWHASLGIQASLTELRSNEAVIENEQSSGGALNLGVGYALSDSWSLHSGVGIGYLKNNASLLNYSGIQNAVDLEGEAFEFRYNLRGYSENQRYTVASIPLVVQYETNGTTRFYARAGASYNIFLTSEAKSRANSLTTTGFFENLNAELEVPKFAGFGTFEDISFAKQNFDIKNAVNATLELGIKQRLVAKQWLYIGFFVETGLNNLLKSNGESLLQYERESPTEFRVNPSLNATNQDSGHALLNDAKFRSLGLKFWYSFNF
jgi:opacity protein-like surface antigen